MPLSAHLLLAATALCCFASLLALPLEGIGSGYRCRCLTTTSTQINSRHFKRIEIVPPGANCRNPEILITTKEDKVVCVSPEAKWVKDVISKAVQKKKKRREAPSPNQQVLT